MRAKFTELVADVEEELKPLAKLEARKLEVRSDNFDLRLKSVGMTVEKARSHAAKMEEDASAKMEAEAPTADAAS